MADDDDATGTPPPGGDDAGTPPAGDADGDGAGSAGTDDQLDAKALAAEVRALRRENAKHRTRAKDAEEKLAAEEAAKLSDQERLQRENDALKAQLAQRDADDARRQREADIAKVAKQKHAVDPDIVAELLVAKIGDDDDVPAAVDALLKDRPYLRAGHTSGSDANGSQSASGAAGADGDAETDEQRRARVYGGGGNIFDPVKAKAAGGGVIIPDPSKVVR